MHAYTSVSHCSHLNVTRVHPLVKDICCEMIQMKEEDMASTKANAICSYVVARNFFCSDLSVLPSHDLVLYKKYAFLFMVALLTSISKYATRIDRLRQRHASSRSLLSSSNSLNSAASSPQGLRSSITRRQMANCGSGGAGGGGSKCF